MRANFASFTPVHSGKQKIFSQRRPKKPQFSHMRETFFSHRLLVCCPLSPFFSRQQILYNTIFFAPQPVRKVPSFLDSCILSAKARFIYCTLALSGTKRTRIKNSHFERIKDRMIFMVSICLYSISLQKLPFSHCKK